MNKTYKYISNWLNKPFPIIESFKQKVITSLLFATFIFTFLLVFQPFSIAAIESNKTLYLFGFFVITFVVMIINFLILPLIFKKALDPDNWTIKKNIYFELWHIIIIAVFNWLYSSIASPEILQSEESIRVQHSLFSFLYITISVGIFPIIFLTIYAEMYLSNKHKIIAEELSNRIHSSNKENTALRIVSENNKEIIEIELQQFLCISSEGNYANIFYSENGKTTKKLIRNSLAKLADQLSNFDSIKRCHRSYIVNMEHVSQVNGNARNYNFILEKLDFSIPVSRNFPKSIIKNISI